MLFRNFHTFHISVFIIYVVMMFSQHLIAFIIFIFSQVAMILAKEIGTNITKERKGRKEKFHS